MRLAMLAAFAMAVHAQERVSVRVLLGVTDTASTVWDGSVQSDGATVDITAVVCPRPRSRAG